MFAAGPLRTRSVQAVRNQLSNAPVKGYKTPEAVTALIQRICGRNTRSWARCSSPPMPIWARIPRSASGSLPESLCSCLSGQQTECFCITRLWCSTLAHGSCCWSRQFRPGWRAPCAVRDTTVPRDHRNHKLSFRQTNSNKVGNDPSDWTGPKKAGQVSAACQRASSLESFTYSHSFLNSLWIWI